MNSLVTDQVSRIKPLFTYLSKQRENQKFTRNTEITATFVLISFFLYFAVRPTFLTISALVGEIKAKQIQKQELKGKINNIIRAQDIFSEIQGRYQIINTSLPDKPQYYNSAYQLTKTGESVGIVINKININTKAVIKEDSGLDPNLLTYTTGIAINGQYSSVVNMIKDLLSNRRLINIDSFVFSNESDGQATSSASLGSNIKTAFTAAFYYWPESYGKK